MDSINNEVVPYDGMLPIDHDSDNLLEFDGCIKFGCGIRPFNRKFLPFYQQMAMQLTQLLQILTDKDFINHYRFVLDYKDITYTGEPYIWEIFFSKPGFYGFSEAGEPIICDLPAVKAVKTDYSGKFFKFHKDSYAYGRLYIYNNVGDFDRTYCYIRWKSNLPEYEYIEPDDELDLGPEDIIFELCSGVSEDIESALDSPYLEHIEGDVLGKFIEFINDEKHYPKKRTKKQKKHNNDFICEISESCEYPDVIFSVYFNRKISDKLKKFVMDEFSAFQCYWDSENDCKIHAVIDADEVGVSCDKEAVNIFVDFGNCLPDVLENVIDWLKHSKLKIKKIIVR